MDIVPAVRLSMALLWCSSRRAFAAYAGDFRLSVSKPEDARTCLDALTLGNFVVQVRRDIDCLWTKKLVTRNQA